MTQPSAEAVGGGGRTAAPGTNASDVRMRTLTTPSETEGAATTSASIQPSRRVPRASTALSCTSTRSFGRSTWTPSRAASGSIELIEVRLVDPSAPEGAAAVMAGSGVLAASAEAAACATWAAWHAAAAAAWAAAAVGESAAEKG